MERTLTHEIEMEILRLNPEQRLSLEDFRPLVVYFDGAERNICIRRHPYPHAWTGHCGEFEAQVVHLEGVYYLVRTYQTEFVDVSELRPRLKHLAWKSFWLVSAALMVVGMYLTVTPLLAKAVTKLFSGFSPGY